MLIHFRLLFPFRLWSSPMYHYKQFVSIPVIPILKSLFTKFSAFLCLQPPYLSFLISHLNSYSRPFVFMIFPVVPILLLYPDTSMICLRKQDLNTGSANRHANRKERNLKKPHPYPKDYKQFMTARRWRIGECVVPRVRPSHWLSIVLSCVLISKHGCCKLQFTSRMWCLKDRIPLLSAPSSSSRSFHNTIGGALNGSWPMPALDPCLFISEWNKYEKILLFFAISWK